jgi:hypothetical protein
MLGPHSTHRPAARINAAVIFVPAGCESVIVFIIIIIIIRTPDPAEIR